MLIQRCELNEHRLVVPISVSKHSFGNGQLEPEPGPKLFNHAEYRALIDTGATRTVVSHKIITEQSLMRVGHMQINSMHGPQTHTRYLASIGFWAMRLDQSQRSEENEKSFYLHSRLIEPVNMNNNANFDAIIGFDVLKHYDFSFDERRSIFEIKLSN